MDVYIKDFFRPIDLKREPTDDEYLKVGPFIDFAKSFSLSTYQSLYIIDYYRRGFVYVSDNPLFLCGLKPSVVQSMGYSFYLKHVPQPDLEMLLEVNQAGFLFYQNIPIAERKEYCISYDFNLIVQSKRQVLINHKLTPILLDKDSNIWLALCAVSLSSNAEPGNIYIRKLNSNKVFHYNLKSKNWQIQRPLKISNTEKEILMLSSRGLTVDEIAAKFHVTPSTIKFHRQNIFHKMNVRNISEALSFATNYNLI